MKTIGTKVLLVMVLLAACLAAPSYAAAGEFMSGSGTEADPYIISNKAHLDNVRNYPNAHFRMVTDITFSEDDFSEDGTFYNDGSGWQTIESFFGTFDGNGKTISGLTITRNTSTTDVVGLFGHNRGTVRSLALEDVCSIWSRMVPTVPPVRTSLSAVSRRRTAA